MSTAEEPGREVNSDRQRLSAGLKAYLEERTREDSPDTVTHKQGEDDIEAEGEQDNGQRIADNVEWYSTSIGHSYNHQLRRSWSQCWTHSDHCHARRSVWRWYYWTQKPISTSAENPWIKGYTDFGEDA